MMPVLSVEDLKIENAAGKTLVDGISFSLEKGKTLGIVGESGSGKSLTLRSVMGLLPRGVRKVSGTIRTAETPAMIFQDPVSFLDPLCPVFRQVREVVAFRGKLSKKEAEDRTRSLFAELMLPEDLAVRDRYPRELSGGQCQRILIAMALACDPGILLCDEPTTALDVTVQKKTLELLKRLQKERGLSMLFVTHNLAVAAGVSDRLLVMQKGRIVEEGDPLQIIGAPEDPYTRRLAGAILDIPRRKEAL